MAITVTEILGTDSISGSRIVINDNFAIIKDEINAIEAYLDPDAGTIDGLNSLSTLELFVGQSGNFGLEITGTVFNINRAVDINSNISINGLLNIDSFGLLDEAAFTGLATINPVNGFASYSIVHASTSDFAIELGAGNPGQDISFFLEQKGGGSVLIQAVAGEVFVLDITNDKVSLTDIGSSVTLRYVTDSTNNGAWYIVSSHNMTLTT
jgi:hypothetical protein